MTIDKFGSHIFKNADNVSSCTDTYKVVNIKDVKLYYNLVLPFIGIYEKKKNIYELLQDNRDSYLFPLKECTIVGAEFPRFVELYINNNKIENPVGVKLKEKDKISFKPSGSTTSKQFYGEFLIKCAIEVNQ